MNKTQLRGAKEQTYVSNIQVPSIGRIVHYVAYGTPKGEYEQGAHRRQTRDVALARVRPTY